MGAQSNLTLNSHTFTPAGVSASGVASWVYSPSGVPSAAEYVTMQMVRPTGQKLGRNVPRVFRLNLTFGKPIVQSDDTAFAPAGTILRNYPAEMSIVLPETGGTDERTDVWTVLKDFLASGAVEDAIEDLVTPTS